MGSGLGVFGLYPFLSIPLHTSERRFRSFAIWWGLRSVPCVALFDIFGSVVGRVFALSVLQSFAPWIIPCVLTVHDSGSLPFLDVLERLEWLDGLERQEHTTTHLPFILALVVGSGGRWA